jgi:hypothetical protein
MTIENEYAQIIFEKLFYPAAKPEDYPVKNGKFDLDYKGETLEVTVKIRKQPQLPEAKCLDCGVILRAPGDRCKCGTTRGALVEKEK